MPSCFWARRASTSGALEGCRDLARAQAEGRQPREPRADRRVGDPLGVELLVDVALEAERPDPLDVAVARAERDPVQHVADRFCIIWNRSRREGNHSKRKGGQ